MKEIDAGQTIPKNAIPIILDKLVLMCERVDQYQYLDPKYIMQLRQDASEIFGKTIAIGTALHIKH